MTRSLEREKGEREGEGEVKDEGGFKGLSSDSQVKGSTWINKTRRSR